MWMRRIRQVDFVLIGVVISLSAFGCLAILAASHGKSIAVVHTSHIVIKQMIWSIFGILAMIAVGQFDYQNLRRIHWWIYGACILLLIGVYGFSRVNGAHSWIHVAGFTIEPSEFAKLSLIISIAACMANVTEERHQRGGLLNFLQIMGVLLVPCALTYKEPALGQALVMVAIVVTMFVIFANRAFFTAFTLLFTGTVVGLSYMLVRMPNQLLNGIQFLVNHHILRQFQVDRIITWINPNYDLNGSGFEIHHAQIAVGSGGLFGEGLFHGVLTNNPGGVPNQTTDYIFTAIAEEFGFVGSVLLILLFLVLIHRIVRIAANSRDSFGTYIMIGVVGMFGFQVFENIGMNMYLSPSTGITLPFISYGGTSVVADYMAVGLALGVAMKSTSLSFSKKK